MKRFNSATARQKYQQLMRANAKPLVMRPPIEPSVAQVETSETHPLWQFFANKTFMRKASDLEDLGAAWSVPQLRRKSFDDLHTLWYVSLKELNKVNREMRLLALYENRPSQDTRRYAGDENRFAEIGEQIKTTMWRIRHVLAERYHAWKATDWTLQQVTPAEASQAWSDFRERFLTADSNADAQVNAQLERFQFAFFGINPLLDSNWAEPTVVRGLYTVAQLKLDRYASGQAEITNVRDIREAYVLFSSEPTPEGVAEALQTVKEIRQHEPVPRERDVEVLAELMHSAQPEAGQQ